VIPERAKYGNGMAFHAMLKNVQLAAIADALSEFIDMAPAPPSTGRILQAA
jgi:hypothetical protein